MSEKQVSYVEILSVALDKLRNSKVDLEDCATEERYRFVNCEAFINKGILRIHETTELPTDPDFYSTVSYVWFGLVASPETLQEDGSFHVYCGRRSDGSLREDGGPINIKVLEYACRWSAEAGTSYLWLDRLCVLQTSHRDKSWQIARMYNICARCRECVVLPGGLQRLASVYEETSWVDRAWTYQEAIVTWEFAVVLTKDWHRPKGEQHWLVEGQCHYQPLHQLFLEGGELLSSSTAANARLILGTNRRALDTLRRIMEYMAFNHIAEEGEEIIGEHTIRQLVLQGVAMRVSSRPVDMVLSIIGLMGAQEQFQMRARNFRENDRFAATLAMVESFFWASLGLETP